MRVCCCLGCAEDAVAVVDHPEYGERTVCDEHAAGLEVIANV